MDDDSLTISLSMEETFFLASLLRSITKREEFADEPRELARRIHQRMIDTAVMDGKVSMESLAPPEVDEDD